VALYGGNNNVPTAVNVSWSKAAADDGTFLPDDQLGALTADAGLELELELDKRDTVAYCRIGERNAHSRFVLHDDLHAADHRLTALLVQHWAAPMRQPATRAPAAERQAAFPIDTHARDR
jgi:3-mercaptopyruvate sulfurtransferase SseA